MLKNTASQKLVVFAFDSTTNLPKTGDAANLTAYVSKDYGSVTVLGDTSATEMDATNAKGYYLFDLTQAETNADFLLFSAKSSTANIVVIGAPAASDTRPAAFGLVAGASGGLLISGSNAGTTTLGAFTVTGATTLTGNVAMAAGCNITQSSSNTSALVVTGNGTGHGAVFTSGAGATGDGVQMNSGSTNGHGLTVDGNGTGAGLNCVAGATGNGIKAAGGATSGDAIITSATSGHGITAAGGGTTKHGVNAVGGATTSAGIAATGGATSGDGILISAPTLGHGISTIAAGTAKNGLFANASGNNAAIRGLGSGTGAGLQLTGGTTGPGAIIAGGGTSGNGLTITAATGNAIDVSVSTSGHAAIFAAKGTSKHGITTTGGDAGTSDGLNCAAGTGGVDIRGAITGNVTGNLSGSVGSVTGLTASNLDTTVSSRLATAGYTAPDNATITAINAKTTNLPSDPADESLIIAATDALATLIDALPTNAELATALGTADDAVLTAIGDLPTNAELATALAAADDAVLTAIGNLNDLSAADVNAEADTAIADAFATTLEGTLTRDQVSRIVLSAIAGKVSGADTTTVTFRDTADTKDRIVATVDADGNRSAITLDAS